MHVLRAEKGYVIVGQETDGTVTPLDLGLDWMVSKRKWFIGARSLRRPAMLAPDRRQLVGLLPARPRRAAARGRSPARARERHRPGRDGGPRHVAATAARRSAGRSPWRCSPAAARGSVATAVVDVDGREVRAAVTAPVFYDPENLRRDG